MINGKLVKLRAIESEDVVRYHAWINDSETNQWRGLYHPTSREEAAGWIEEQRQKRPEHLSLSIESDGVHVGFIGLRGICARSRRAEIWIYIGAKDYWNQGIGQDAIQTLCDYAFTEMNLFRIWLECNSDFVPVVRCYEKVGFLEEGRPRKAYYRNGKFHDTCIMGLLKDEWAAVRSERDQI
jgi:RimJ/RimL family protein N-acetyltransferase